MRLISVGTYNRRPCCHFFLSHPKCSSDNLIAWCYSFCSLFFFLNFGGFLSALNPCKSCELIFIFHMQCIFIFLFSNFISLANSYQSVWSRFVRWKMVPPPVVFYNYFLICQICVLGKRDLFTLSQGWSIYLTCCNNFFLSPFSELI